MPVDYLITLDDMLCERYRHCTLCGRLAAQWMDIRTVDGRAWCACLCRRCHGQHGWGAVEVLLRERYGQGPG